MTKYLLQYFIYFCTVIRERVNFDQNKQVASFNNRILGQYMRTPVNPEYIVGCIVPLLCSFSTLTWSPVFSFTMTVLLIWMIGLPLCAEDT